MQLDGIVALALRLLLEKLHHFGPLQSVGEPRIVLHLGRVHQLPAGAQSLDNDGFQVGPGAVDGGRQAGGAGPQDDDFVYVLGHTSLRVVEWTSLAWLEGELAMVPESVFGMMRSPVASLGQVL